MKPSSRLSLLLVALVFVRPAAADPAPAGLGPSDTPPPAHFNRFSVAPRSMQADPLLDITVMTDVTDAGKKLPLVTKDHPAYYLAHSQGFQQRGEGTPSGETLSEEDMGRILRHSLANGGYLEAEPAGKPPSLVILYSWGLYSKRIDTDQGLSETSQDIQEMYDRAELVGGDDFVKKVVAMMKWKATVGASSTHHHHTSNIADPMYVYKEEGTTHALMLEMANHDLYYVIATAYDYTAFRQHQSVLLWRTRVAILAEGVSQPQVLPTMVLGASASFGKQTHGDPTILTQHAVGQVEVGPLKVVGFGTETEAPQAPADSAPPAPPPPPVPPAK